MLPFKTLSAIAAPLPLINVDTDMIIPKQFLKTIKRTGLGKHLFDEMRFDMQGKEIADFVLNKEPFRKAEILVSSDNFGCGSSREHAPWALLDFGIRCVIAPSFADIFYNNCFKNGILPIKLPKELQEKVMEWIIGSKGTRKLTVDLPNQTISADGLDKIHFDVEPFRKHCLVNGLDDIGLTLEKRAKIDAFEAIQKTNSPWLYTKKAA